MPVIMFIVFLGIGGLVAGPIGILIGFIVWLFLSILTLIGYSITR